MWKRKPHETISEKPEEEDNIDSDRNQDFECENSKSLHKNKIDKILDIHKNQLNDFNVFNILKGKQKKLLIEQSIEDEAYNNLTKYKNTGILPNNKNQNKYLTDLKIQSNQDEVKKIKVNNKALILE